MRHGRLVVTRAIESASDSTLQTAGGEYLAALRNGQLARRSAPKPNKAEPLEGAAEQPSMAAAFGTGSRAMIVLFVLSVLLPLNWRIGSIRLTPYLLLLALSTLPCMALWLGRRRTPIILSDILMLCYCAWASIALLLAGMDNPIQGLGVLFLQCFGTYLLARMTIRDAAAMRFMVKTAVVALIVMLPFVVIEAVTGRNVILQAAHIFGRTHEAVDAGRRLGLHRAQGPFEHPILMGVFCASLLAFSFYGFRNSRYKILRWVAAPAPFMTAILSLSTGSLLAINVQLGFMLWARLTRAIKDRWRILTTGFVALYLLLDIFTTKSPIHTFVRYMTFSAQSSYNRILIWEFGSAEALRHPLFGIGMGEWQRPRYMSSSMDNFWLVQAVRYGMPALAMLFTAIWLILSRAGKMELHDRDDFLLRRGACFSIVAMMIAIVSVHLWNATFVWFMFLVGSCGWMSVPQRQALQPDGK
jgi:hypothetical protein